MRSPTVLGVVAALAVGAIAIVTLLTLVGSRPAAVPSAGVPTAPPLETKMPSPATSSPGAPGATASPGTSADASAAVTQPPEGLEVGQRAPRLDLPLLGGGRVDTADYRGQPVWINFMATWCPQCQDELPMMESMQAQLDEELTVVLVDVGEDRDKVAAFMNALNVDLPTGLDEDGTAQQRWSAYALPVHFWIDGEGVIQAKLFGGAPRDLFIESIRAVAPEAEVE